MIASFRDRYFAALIFVAAITSIPVLCGIITIVFYLSPTTLPKTDNSHSLSNEIAQLLHWLGPNTMVLILGLIITFIAWLLLGLLFQPFATFEHGRSSDSEDILKELSILKARYKVLKEERDQEKTPGYPQMNGTEHENGTVKDIALEEIETQIHDMHEIMKKSGLLWVLSTGYINLWSRINRVQEIMIDLLPRPILIESAKYDDLRLSGSDVPNKQNLQKLLEKAINTLSSSPTSNGQDVKQSDEQGVRSDLHKVKSALHKFTEERWAGLVLARNQLMITAFATGFFTYLLVVIAILSNIAQVSIKEAMVFYSLGIIVGLFGQLYNEWQSKDPASDDYGQTIARIIVTPLLSGLAAIVGVFLVVMLSITLITPQNSSSSINNPTSTPTTVISANPSPTTIGITSGTSNQSNFPKLETIFDIDTYPQNLLYAAIFGFLPSLVIPTQCATSSDR